MRAEVEAKAKAAGFPSVEAYVVSLIVEDVPGEVLPPPGYTPPPEITPRNRAELEAMLEDGMNSGPPIRATPEFWENLRQRVETRHADRPDDKR
jgi:hypothetical protein